MLYTSSEIPGPGSGAFLAVCFLIFRKFCSDALPLIGVVQPIYSPTTDEVPRPLLQGTNCRDRTHDNRLYQYGQLPIMNGLCLLSQLSPLGKITKFDFLDNGAEVVVLDCIAKKQGGVWQFDWATNSGGTGRTNTILRSSPVPNRGTESDLTQYLSTHTRVTDPSLLEHGIACSSKD